MSTDLKTLRGLAHLARLEFDETREQQMLGDLNKILDWVAQLSELDTEGVAPLVHLSQEINVLRDDESRNTVTHPVSPNDPLSGRTHSQPDVYFRAVRP